MSLRRLTGLCCVLMVLTAVILARVYWVGTDTTYAASAGRQATQTTELPRARGNFLTAPTVRSPAPIPPATPSASPATTATPRCCPTCPTRRRPCCTSAAIPPAPFWSKSAKPVPRPMYCCWTSPAVRCPAPLLCTCWATSTRKAAASQGWNAPGTLCWQTPATRPQPSAGQPPAGGCWAPARRKSSPSSRAQAPRCS